MTEKCKRQQWQLHLSTLILTMLIGGVLLGLNSTARIEVSYGQATVGNGNEAVPVKTYNCTYYRGWPVRFEHAEEGFKSAIFLKSLGANIGICFAILLVCLALYEFRLRHRESRGMIAGRDRFAFEFGCLAIMGTLTYANLTFYEHECVVLMGWPFAFEGYYKAGSLYNRDVLNYLNQVQSNRSQNLILDVVFAVAVLAVFLIVCRWRCSSSIVSRPSP